MHKKAIHAYSTTAANTIIHAQESYPCIFNYCDIYCYARVATKIPTLPVGQKLVVEKYVVAKILIVEMYVRPKVAIPSCEQDV